MKKLSLIRALTELQTRTRISSTARSLCSSAPAPPAPNAPLKNVTKSNFEPALVELRSHVSQADFVSIDLEMTGVTSAPWRESLECDRLDIQYMKVKDSAEKFAVVQFGVCTFRWDSNAQFFIAHPHNFYIFPRQETSGEVPAHEFLCQTSSLEFLAKYQFDFNACIYEGISYLSRSQEEEALRRLDSLYKDGLSDSPSNSGEDSGTQLVRIPDILFAERMKNKIGEWRDRLLQNRNVRFDFEGSSNETNQKFQTTFFGTRPALGMSGFTSRQLSLIRLVTGKNFKDLAYVQVTDETSGPKPLIVYTDSPTDKDFLMREVKTCHIKEKAKNIKAAVGFRHVIDLLSSERKLIVGHNCFLDIAHIYSKFVGRLPSSAEEFASSVHEYFPYLVDTKLLLNSDDVLFQIMKKGSTSLSKAFSLLCPQIASSVAMSSLVDKSHIKVEVQVDDQRFSNWNSGAKHEAGYDAFMTGCVFAQSCYHLGIDFTHHSPPLDLLYDEKLQKYINHLYLTWANGDIINLKTGKSASESLISANLRKPQNKIFSNMVLFWGLTPTLKARDIRECLCKVFGISSITSVHHLDETAAIIQFKNSELVHEFLELKNTLERENDPISVLHPLSRILEGGCTGAACYEIYKEICSSCVSKVLFTDQVKALVGIKLKTQLVEKQDMISGKENKISGVHNMSIGDFQTDESADASYPIEAQLSK